MKALIDTNILLDVLTRRASFAASATAVWALAEEKHFEGMISGISFTTLFYLGRRNLGREAAMAAIVQVHRIFDVAEINRRVITDALNSGMPDFEDAVQAFSGLHAGASHIVTRDPHGFAGGPLIVLSPEQLVLTIASQL